MDIEKSYFTVSCLFDPWVRVMEYFDSMLLEIWRVLEPAGITMTRRVPVQYVDAKVAEPLLSSFLLCLFQSIEGIRYQKKEVLLRDSHKLPYPELRDHVFCSTPLQVQ